MKIFIPFLFLWSLCANAAKLFLEPGVFVNMRDSSKAVYKEAGESFHGHMRNDGLSYALKFGVHMDHWEFGIESELYHLAGHFEGKKNGDFVKEAQITYNSLFLGYEFIPEQFLYLAVSGRPHLRSGSDSLTEHQSIVSLEYSNHIKEWVSFNIKVETASKFKHGGNSTKSFEFQNLLLFGFSFPLIAQGD